MLTFLGFCPECWLHKADPSKEVDKAAPQLLAATIFKTVQNYFHAVMLDAIHAKKKKSLGCF